MLSSLDPVEDLRVPPFEPGLLPTEHHTLFVLPLFATFPPSVSLLKEPSCLLPVHIPLLELNTPLHTVFTPQKLLLLLLCTNPHPILASPPLRKEPPSERQRSSRLPQHMLNVPRRRRDAVGELERRRDRAGREILWRKIKPGGGVGGGRRTEEPRSSCVSERKHRARAFVA